VTITQGFIKKGAFDPDLRGGYVTNQEFECNN